MFSKIISTNFRMCDDESSSLFKTLYLFQMNQSRALRESWLGPLMMTNDMFMVLIYHTRRIPPDLWTYLTLFFFPLRGSEWSAPLIITSKTSHPLCTFHANNVKHLIKFKNIFQENNILRNIKITLVLAPFFKAEFKDLSFFYVYKWLISFIYCSQFCLNLCLCILW